ncbi:MAG: serine/threonine-protein kinase [Cyanobacteriota bacterium]|nr:serine/threonine-protein kinase [Cyanobacteriota bacterium]
MTHCLNPNCLKPDNPDCDRFCLSCGSLLWLKERYIALQLLGQGGFGRTFIGSDRHLPTSPPCVIKQLDLQLGNLEIQNKAIALFEQEALHLQNLGIHPQIPTLFAYFQQEGQFYLVQEYVDGETLDPDLWQQGGDLEGKTWQLLQDILPILQFVGDRNVVHRDIKPANIIQRRDGKFVLIDFGISRVLTNTALMGGATIVGTPGFMAPEQLYGKVLPASDLYSLGVTCVNLLTGLEADELYDPVTEQWLWRDRLPPDTKISPKLSKILNSLLYPSLRQRSSSAAAVLRAMGVSASPPTTIKPKVRVRRSSSMAKKTVVSNPRSQNPLKKRVLIDYTQLKQLLSRRRWKEADAETRAILCQLVGKPAIAYLDNSEIAKLPCRDLNAIDSLWFKSSKGKFGFGVQAQIYNEVGGEYNLFCDRVNWTVHRSSNEENSLIFSLRAPAGHLPSRCWVSGYHWWKHAEIMAKRVVECSH